MRHKNSALGRRHGAHNWEYADSSARVAATGFLSSDVNKIALQLDTMTFWILTDDSPITWVESGAASLATEVAALEAAISAAVEGLSWKTAVRAATTANITLSGAQTIDGVSVVAGNRVLVKNQSTASQNGIYLCASGSWTRASDLDAAAEFPSATVTVQEGTTLADTSWTCTNNATVTVGSTSIVFVQTGVSGGDASTNTSSSIDSEVALFSGTGGKTIKRASGTGVAKLASGVLSASDVNLATEVTGVLAVANFTTGTPSGSKFVRDDGVLAVPASGGDIIATLVNSEVSVTGATTLTTGAFGKMHVCSGTSYTVGLPTAAGNAGKIIGLRMAVLASLTGFVTIDGNGTELIDGDLFKLMWASESAILLSDGTGWTKLAGRSRALAASMEYVSQTAVANATVVAVPFDTKIFDSTGSLMADTTNHRINIKRGGVYDIEGYCGLEANGVSVAGAQVQALIGVNSTSTPASAPSGIAVVPSSVTGGNTYGYANLSNIRQLATSDWVTLLVVHTIGSSMNTRNASGVIMPRLSLVEQSPW